MSKRQTKLQASSERAAFGAHSNDTAFGPRTGVFGKSSNLSYLTEPLDLSTISDSDVKVAFKNVSKKDETTKSKALEELQTHVSSWDAGKETVEDGVLEAWVCLLIALDRPYTEPFPGRCLPKAVDRCLPSSTATSAYSARTDCHGYWEAICSQDATNNRCMVGWYF